MGIGRFIALGCAERGANVTIGDIDAKSLDSVREEVAAHGHGVVVKQTDVRVERDAKALMDAAAAEFGGIDYLVNNAAIVPHFNWDPTAPRWPKVRDMEFDFYAQVFGVNVLGLFLCCKHAIPFMEQQRSGHIVNLYGGGGLTPPGALAYVVTKDAGVSFTRFLAEEEREFNICVMSISPGAAIATERAPDEARSRLPAPDSVGERFFLAADADMDLSGHLVNFVDGKLVAAN